MGYQVLGYDPFAPDLPDYCAARAGTMQDVVANSFDEASSRVVVVSSLPNDHVLRQVCFGDKMPGLAELMPPGSVHISTSTVSPALARELNDVHSTHKTHFVSAPVFARPDGLAQKAAYFPVAGNQEIIEEIVKPLLGATATRVVYFGEKPELANVVKLSGNFMIASAIEAQAEAYDIAQSYGLDRGACHEFFSTSIFDCLIYRGYGHRVAFHDHEPYENAHFSLELGHKDVQLARAAAQANAVEVPFLEVLDETFEKAKKENLHKQDWSAISMV